MYIESSGNSIQVDENEKGYVVDFKIKYDTDNDDTVSYPLKNEETISELSEIMGNINMAQILTSDNTIELLIGASKIGSPEVFFSLVDYGKEVSIGTTKTYRININKEISNYDLFDKLVKLVSKDISMVHGEENEYQFNTIKH